jgi:hypothetical protein
MNNRPLFCLLLCAALCLVGCSGADSSSRPERRVWEPGTIVTISNASLGEPDTPVRIYTDVEAFDEATKSYGADDLDGIKSLVFQSRVWNVGAGTHARVLDQDVWRALLEVRLQEGHSEGRVVYVPEAVVTRERS